MSKDATVPLTGEIAEFITSVNAKRLPDAALDLAERALVDTVGVAMAAGSQPTVRSMWAAFGARWPSGSSSLLTEQRRTQPVQAALFNGTAAHALDFDDVADDIIGHPSAVLAPAVIALGEDIAASGQDILTAYCLGFQVECALAAGMSMSRHYARGWHSTATLGVLGAAAASAWLLRLEPDDVRHALGIAASLAAGSRQNFGTMTKPLHAGTAAANGVSAGQLAAAGFTADPEQLEGPLGFFGMYGEELTLPTVLDVLGGPWTLPQVGLNVKKHPCCYKAARAADAALAIAENGVHADEVAAVSATVEPEGLGPLIHHRPLTGLEGKFSLEYVVAACLLDGRLTLRSFTDTAVGRAEAQQLLRKVTVAESATTTPPPRGWYDASAELQVSTSDGRVLTRRVDTPRGHAREPLSEEELREKFDECCGFGEAPMENRVSFPDLRALRDRPTVKSLFHTTCPPSIHSQ